MVLLTVGGATTRGPLMLDGGTLVGPRGMVAAAAGTLTVGLKVGALAVGLKVGRLTRTLTVGLPEGPTEPPCHRWCRNQKKSSSADFDLSSGKKP